MWELVRSCFVLKELESCLLDNQVDELVKMFKSSILPPLNVMCYITNNDVSKVGKKSSLES